MFKFKSHLMTAAVAAAAIANTLAGAGAADKIRIGVPTKAYWPTMIVETGIRQKLFAKEGLDAEMTIFRGGAEAFEALPAGASDLILSSVWLIATGQTKGVMTKAVAGGQLRPSGWYLMVRSDSKAQNIKDLDGKKIGITSAGSGSDFLALWAFNKYGVKMTRVPLGGGGLVPNLLAGNVDAAVVYSPLSFQISRAGDARSILDYSKEVPPNLTAGWIVLDKYAQEKPQNVQKALNALYGALQFMRANRDVTVKLISDLYEMPVEIAALEYENTRVRVHHRHLTTV